MGDILASPNKRTSARSYDMGSALDTGQIEQVIEKNILLIAGILRELKNDAESLKD
jgi:hypothetical protein